MQRILAIGGGGFLMETDPSPIDDYLLRLTKKNKPRVCFVSTPSGDLPEHLEKFYGALAAATATPSYLAFVRDPTAGGVPVAGFEQHLLSQDAIFVGGGNTKSALAIWREWGLDLVLKRALSAGVLLSGMSAGAMCWFQYGLTDTFWSAGYHPLSCLGFLAGGCGVHYSSAARRRARVHAAIEAAAIPPSVAIDDYAAVLYCDAAVARVVSWRDGATAYQVSFAGGHAQEAPYQSERIRCVDS
jgi:peptidase E